MKPIKLIFLFLLGISLFQSAPLAAAKDKDPKESDDWVVLKREVSGGNAPIPRQEIVTIFSSGKVFKETHETCTGRSGPNCGAKQTKKELASINIAVIQKIIKKVQALNNHPAELKNRSNKSFKCADAPVTSYIGFLVDSRKVLLAINESCLLSQLDAKGVASLVTLLNELSTSERLISVFDLDFSQ